MFDLKDRSSGKEVLIFFKFHMNLFYYTSINAIILYFKKIGINWYFIRSNALPNTCSLTGREQKLPKNTRLWSYTQKTVDDSVWYMWVRTPMRGMLYFVSFPRAACFFSHAVASYIAVYCLLAVFIFMSMSLVPLVLDVVWPLNESRPILPTYPGYYFVDTREYFFKIFWHSIVSWEILIAGVLAHDCMFVTYVEHVCSMFATVG